MDKLTVETLKKVLKSIEPQGMKFNHEFIDKFVAKGGDFENSMIVHSEPKLSDCRYIETKHGVIDFVYSAYLPKDEIYIVNKTVGKKAVERFFPSVGNIHE